MVSHNPHFPGRKTIEADADLRRAVDVLRAQGGEVSITVDGQTVGRFVPETNGATTVGVIEAVQFIEEFGRRHTLGGVGWKALRDEGRR